MTAGESPKGSIMVVDDQPANLDLLEEMLRSQGYRVRVFPRGRLALAAAVQNPPDLILLDINMPEMNGYEVCAHLKADARLKEIPVIFLSALNETGDKVKAFQSGGVDYITKPFQFDEVRARVEAHSQLHHLQGCLRRQNEHLEELVQARTRELAEAHARLQILDSAKADFLHLISHELRTPLNGLLGVAELVLEESGAEGELRAMFAQSRRRLLVILEDAMLLSQIQVEGEKFACERLPLDALLGRAVAQSEEIARSRQVTLEAAPAAGALVAKELLVKALQSLLETAVKFSKSGEKVRLACQCDSGAAHIRIETRGRTVPEALIPKFFDLLAIGQAITAEGDLGLSPAVAYRILSLFGGAVAVENCGPAGIRLSVHLPCTFVASQAS